MNKSKEPLKWANLARRGFVLCNEYAMLYGACVLKHSSKLAQNECRKEFTNFYGCMTNSIAKRRGLPPKSQT